MRRESYPESLLHDVLGEPASTSPTQRAVLLGQMVRVAQARRRRRRIGAALLLVGLVSLPAILFGPSRPTGGTSAQAVREPGGASAATSLPACALIRSQPLPGGMLVRSDASTVQSVITSREGLVIVETIIGPGLVREVSDQELLNLLAGRPAALVRPPERPAELLLFNAEDRNGFPIR